MLHGLGRIVVPTVAGKASPAAMALHLEGVEFQALEMEDDLAYSRLFTECWRTGEGFTVVEHDVVPWPGAMQELDSCRRSWCCHWYPLGPGTIRPALGCVRFSAQLTQVYDDLCDKWEGVAWNQLDGAVYKAMADIGLGRPVGPHRHMPDFAHVK